MSVVYIDSITLLLHYNSNNLLEINDLPTNGAPLVLHLQRYVGASSQRISWTQRTHEAADATNAQAGCHVAPRGNVARPHDIARREGATGRASGASDPVHGDTNHGAPHLPWSASGAHISAGSPGERSRGKRTSIELLAFRGESDNARYVACVAVRRTARSPRPSAPDEPRGSSGRDEHPRSAPCPAAPPPRRLGRTTFAPSPPAASLCSVL